MTRARIIIAVVVVLAIVGTIFAIRRGGEKAGEAKVTAQAKAQHAERIAEARSDERQAAAVADSIGRRVDRADALSTQAVQATIKDLRDALDAVPPAPAGAPVPAAPVDQLREDLNAGVDRANRAADAAEAIP